jgi:hypothetical protein
MIQVRTDAVMVPVRLEHVQAIADFLYRRMPMAESEQMVGWLRAAAVEHQRKAELEAKRKEALERHEALTRETAIANNDKED